MMVDPSDPFQRKISNGIFEEGIITYFLNQFGDQEGDFVDVGANIGLYSLLYTTHADGTVDAFEPLPSNVKQLQLNTELNDADISIHEFALGSSWSSQTLTLNPDNRAEASLSGTTMHGGESKEVTIEIRPFSEVRSASPEVMKIDVEGAEYDVIKGAQPVLEENPPELLVEIHPKLLREFGYSVSVYIELLQDVGYSQFYYVEGDEKVSPDQIPDISEVYGFHIHASP